MLTGDGASVSSQGASSSGQGATDNGQAASRSVQAAGNSAQAAGGSAQAANGSGQGAAGGRGRAPAGAGAGSEHGSELGMDIDIVTVDSPVRTHATDSADATLAHAASAEADGGCEQVAPFSPQNASGSRETARGSAQAPGISGEASNSSGKEPAAAGTESEYESAMDIDIMTVDLPVKTGVHTLLPWWLTLCQGVHSHSSMLHCIALRFAGHSLPVSAVCSQTLNHAVPLYRCDQQLHEGLQQQPAQQDSPLGGQASCAPSSNSCSSG